MTDDLETRLLTTPIEHISAKALQREAAEEIRRLKAERDEAQCWREEWKRKFFDQQEWSVAFAKTYEGKVDAEVAALRQELAATSTKLDRQWALLVDLEWAGLCVEWTALGHGLLWSRTCPACGGLQARNSHTPDCRLAAALAVPAASACPPPANAPDQA